MLTMKTIILIAALVSASTASGLFRTPICMELNEPLTPTINGPQHILLQGTLLDNSGFYMGLTDGEGDVCKSDISATVNIVFHLRIRLSLGYIVRNTLVLKDKSLCIGTCGLSWGPEETSGGMPLEVGKPFDIRIISETNYFQIYVNGKFHASYAYRLPLQRITHMLVNGAAKFSRVDVIRSSPENRCCASAPLGVSCA